MNEPRVDVLLAVLNNRKELMNRTELSLLWDYYKFRSKGTPQLSEKKLALCLKTWTAVQEREKSGEQPLSELADLKWRMNEMEETIKFLVEAYEELAKSKSE